MDDRERRTAAEQVRIAALAIAAIARIGTGTPPAQLMSEAAQYVPWITRPPAWMLLSIATEGEPEMPLTVDSVNAVAVLSFTDDHSDAVAPPAGALAVATSSDTAVLTVGAAVAGADATVSRTCSSRWPRSPRAPPRCPSTTTDADGSPLLGPDGVTPIPAPDPVVVTVTPGAPAAEVFTVPGNCCGDTCRRSRSSRSGAGRPGGYQAAAEGVLAEAMPGTSGRRTRGGTAAGRGRAGGVLRAGAWR